jgi:hypothetical protein
MSPYHCYKIYEFHQPMLVHFHRFQYLHYEIEKFRNENIENGGNVLALPDGIHIFYSNGKATYLCDRDWYSVHDYNSHYLN